MPSEMPEKAHEGKLGRTLNSLEVLLLVFVSYGQRTTYDLMAHAGMSPGLTAPALKRMKAAGLLTTSTGARKVVRYSLTKSGHRIMQNSLQSAGARNWWLEPNTFYENWPRSLFLIWLTGGFHKAHDWIMWAEEEIKELGAKKRNEAKNLEQDLMRLSMRYQEDPDSCDRGSILAHAYRAMKANSEAATLARQAKQMQVNIHLLWGLTEMQLSQDGEETGDQITDRE